MLLKCKRIKLGTQSLKTSNLDIFPSSMILCTFSEQVLICSDSSDWQLESLSWKISAPSYVISSGWQSNETSGILLYWLNRLLQRPVIQAVSAKTWVYTIFFLLVVHVLQMLEHSAGEFVEMRRIRLNNYRLTVYSKKKLNFKSV